MSDYLDELADLCPQTIVWQQLTGRDEYGKGTYGPAQTFTGRRVFRQTRIPSFGRQYKGQGADVISETTVIIFAVLQVGYEDRVYVQGDTEYPPVLNSRVYPDEDGDLYTEVNLGSAFG